jgi:hypothetical protein
MVFGSVFSSSFTLPDNAFAADMDMGGGDSGDGEPEDDSAHGGGGSGDGGKGGGSGDGGKGGGSGDGGKGGDSETGDGGDGGSRGDSETGDGGRSNNNDDDNKPPSEDSGTGTTTKKLECPKSQEATLFSRNCVPAGKVDSTEGPASAATANPKSVYVPYKPPDAALPYHGNEIELIESYDRHDVDNVKKYDTKGRYGRFTFNDGTIKEGTYGADILGPEGSTRLQDIKITPGSGTPLDKLGVKEVRLPHTGATNNEVHYKDGNTVVKVYERDFMLDFYGEIFTTMKNGKILERVYVNEESRETWASNYIDGSSTDYKDDGNYIKVWPSKADGSYQFYDSKQQKVFVRDANGNIIPPKE